MKKIILTSIFLFICMAANAQWGGAYKPYVFHDSPSSFDIDMQDLDSRPSTQYHDSQPQKETIQTTAYYKDNNGNYRKIPIKVTIAASQFSPINITAYYNYNYGQWQNLVPAIPAIKCNGAFGGGMESSFMYKASSAIWPNTIYFDL